MTLYDSRWPPSTLKLLGRLESNEAAVKDFAEWGMDALAAGFDSPALRRLAKAIADGATNLDELLQTIHETVINPLDHREDRMPWCCVRGDLQSGNPEPLGEEGIRALARTWLEDRGASN